MNALSPRLIAGFALLVAPLSAQTLLRQFDGANADEAVGRSVASAGDVNADGYADVLVGADWIDANGRNSGEVHVYDGQALANGTVTLLHTLAGNSIGDFFGYSCASAGDVNGDGYCDIVVGAYGDDPANTLDAGSAYVFDGHTGQLIYEFNGSTQAGVGSEDRFGWDVSGAGDVNGDGYDDVIVGAYTADVGALGDAGYAAVFSGRDGAELFRYEGTAALQFAGFSVSGAGDVDGDGWDDVMVGVVADATVGAFGGSVQLLAYDSTQPNGYRLVRRYDSAAGGDLLGASVGNAGDVNGDFVPDQIVGAPFGDPSGQVDRGMAIVYSGSDGSVLHQFGGFFVTSLHGLSVAGAGDVDGDGFDDLIVGAPLDSTGVPVSGSAFIYSGANGQLLGSVGGSGVADIFGWAVASAGDIDQDGYSELLVGAPFADPGGLISAGSAYLYDDLRSVMDPARVREIGAACPHAGGSLPTATVGGRPHLGGAIQLGLRGTLPNNLCVLNLAEAFTPPVTLGALGFQISCTAYVKTNGFIVSSFANSAGVATKSTINVPNATQFIGASIYAQWICVDAGVAGQHVFSDALELTLGR